MFFYAVYLAGYYLCLTLPRPVALWTARRLADASYARSPRDREAVSKNLSAVLNTPRVPAPLVREVFRNFAMYLVDFFLFSRLDHRRLSKWIRVEGLENAKRPFQEGRGGIGVTAHLGNYELAGAYYSLMGIPVNAVVLTHQNPFVDRFFNRQRQRVGVKALAIQRMSPRRFVEEVQGIFRRNEMLALVCDRDFFHRGVKLSLFGRPIQLPTGPAAFSVRHRVPIIPTFLIREKDGNYRLFVEPPLSAPQGMPGPEAELFLTRELLAILKRYIERFPTQWYLFQEFWKPAPPLVV
ncbi:MAG: lysophospholipid acyltransferase family protein [Candidatus Omnitrophica bacterium]|nr:lysophospholipid acyltransferase family protein [Candidatus Omnitrophota bacterium]